MNKIRSFLGKPNVLVYRFVDWYYHVQLKNTWNNINEISGKICVRLMRQEPFQELAEMKSNFEAELQSLHHKIKSIRLKSKQGSDTQST